MKLAETVKLWLAQKTVNTRQSYEHAIETMTQLVGPQLELEAITPVHLTTYAEHVKNYTFKDKHGIKQRYAQKTIHKHIKTTKTFFNWCVKKELLAKSPARVLETPKVDRHIPRDKAMIDSDLDMLLKYTQNNPMVNAILYLVAESGMRRGAVVQMRDNEKRLFLDAVQPYALTIEKGGKLVPVRIGDGARIALRKWLLRRPICDHDYIFVTRKKKPVTADYLDLIIRRVAQRIERDTGYKFQRWNLHSLRHRLAHKELDEGTPISLVTTLLNHESELTTIQNYSTKDHETAWEQASRHDLPAPEEIHPTQKREAKIIDLTKLLGRNA